MHRAQPPVPGHRRPARGYRPARPVLGHRHQQGHLPDAAHRRTPGPDARQRVLVCGDTTAHAKPHPLPLLHAAEQAGFEAGRCVYVGDDLRDIQAAHAAGMPAVAAAYGYVGMEEDVTTWQAEACAASPRELWSAIEPLLPARATA
ncbi:HAD-IA family hydrolase [Bordetella bronchiseptica]|uniref:HAD-IA family hydrolase n=1 Tax=Bordetella bronchiseptica TaxID=518 RepID=UPI002AB2625B|nr:HAD-IA family hydrolase [Bordetella bronchiseptica]